MDIKLCNIIILYLNQQNRMLDEYLYFETPLYIIFRDSKIIYPFKGSILTIYKCSVY